LPHTSTSDSGQRGLTGRQDQNQKQIKVKVKIMIKIKIKIKINCGDGWRYVN